MNPGGGAGPRPATRRARPAGTYTPRWDGRAVEVRPLASGAYLYRPEADAQVEIRKLLLLH